MTLWKRILCLFTGHRPTFVRVGPQGAEPCQAGIPFALIEMSFQEGGRLFLRRCVRCGVAYADWVGSAPPDRTTTIQRIPAEYRVPHN